MTHTEFLIIYFLIGVGFAARTDDGDSEKRPPRILWFIFITPLWPVMLGSILAKEL